MTPTKKSVISFLALFLMIILSVNCGNGNDKPALKDAFKDHFLIGTAVNDYQSSGKDEKSIELIKKHFNSITPENMLKWERVHPKPGVYNFDPVDKMMAFGEENNMFIIGHCLVWHSQTPKWVFEDENGNPATREQLLERLKDHIFTVVGKYKGRIKGWDVVNEAVMENGELRNSPWLRIIGEDFIEKAFMWAHEADPDAELYYNDFNMWHSGKVERVVNLVKEFKEKGIRIDGIGLQGHWGLDYPPMDELDEAMSAYAKTGLQLLVTELDMDILPQPSQETGADISRNFELRKELNPYPDALPDSMITVQTNRFVEYFSMFNKYKDNINRVTLWGAYDTQSWRNHWPVRGRTAYPLLFDKNFQPKPAVEAIINEVMK